MWKNIKNIFSNIDIVEKIYYRFVICICRKEGGKGDKWCGWV